MIVTFPHMGTMHIPFQLLFKTLGVEVLLPPPTTKKTLELGTKYSPETVCLPFKIVLGNFIEALSLGADTLVTCGGIGPCRLGYYAEIQSNILRKLGYSFNMIVLEPDIVSAYKAMHELFPGRNWFTIYQAVKLAWIAFQSLDAIERRVCYLRPYAADAGKTEILWQQFLAAMEQAGTVIEIQNLQEIYSTRLEQAEKRTSHSPLRLGIIGEIFVLLEPFVNQNLVRRLGEMGAEVYKSMYLADYIRIHLIKKQPFYRDYRNTLRLAAPYLGQNVGGHGRDGIGNAIRMAQDGFDGIIHILPFTCMPEIIAKNILPQISKNYDIPILSLTFDEQSGEAGVITRLEAFVDLLKYRHAERKEISK